MNYIQLFISDYDRTLTDPKLIVEDKTIETLAKLKKNNVKVAIVSGRKYSYMKSFYDRHSEVIDVFIAENGCIGFAKDRKEIICHNKDYEKILEALNSNSIQYDPGDVVISVNSIYEKKLSKILTNFENSHIIKNIDSLMILPKESSKGTGVKWISNILNIGFPHIACIGDGENDIEMRQCCSILGAVANSVPELKKAADYICEKSYGEGMQEFVEKIILKSK